jgi:hypothetical protein
MDPDAYREAAARPGTVTGGLVEGWRPAWVRQWQQEHAGATR